MTEKTKNEHAVALGRLGGEERARVLTAEERSAIARQGAAKRWEGKELGMTHALAPGDRLGKLVLVTPVVMQVSGKPKPGWVARCDCGVTKEVSENKLRYRGQESCGCAKNAPGRRSAETNKAVSEAMHAGKAAKSAAGGGPHKLAKGAVVGQLTLVTPGLSQQKNGPGRVANKPSWECRCACGTMKTVLEGNLLKTEGGTRSCGCQKYAVHTTHGEAVVGEQTPEYLAWQGMKRRCYNKNDPTYADWGGRGITVCDRWRDDFAAFLADMGRKPSEAHSLDRVDNEKGYELSNCRWATAGEQRRNQRRVRMLTLDGVSNCPTDWAKILGVPYPTIMWRIKQGWSDVEVLRGR